MKVKNSISIFVIGLLCMTSARAGDILDRIVATVNGQIILQSDWENSILYEAFLAKRPLSEVNVVDRKAALDHLIDQELLREQTRASDAVPGEQEVEKQVEEVRSQYGTEAAGYKWNQLLAAHGLTAQELRRRIALQVELTRLVDAHLRPAANITSKNVESYYQQELLPQLHQAGAKDVPLVEVSPKIKELLTQQKISELLVSWLRDLRAGSQIRTQLYPSRGENVSQ